MRQVNVPRQAFLLVIAVLGCGGGGGGGPTSTTPPTPPVTANAVVVASTTFTPAALSTTKNATVTWTWDSCSGGDSYGAGQTCVAHDIVFDDGAAGSGTMSTGSFSRTFSAAGTFPYHCAIHGAAMSGKVVVQ